MRYEERRALYNAWSALRSAGATGAELDMDYAKQLAEGLHHILESLPQQETETIVLRGGKRDGMFIENVPYDLNSISVAYIDDSKAVRFSPYDPKPELDIREQVYQRTRERQSGSAVFIAPTIS